MAIKLETNRTHHDKQRDGTPTQLLRGHWLPRGLIERKVAHPASHPRTCPSTAAASALTPGWLGLLSLQQPPGLSVLNPVCPTSCTHVWTAGTVLHLQTSEHNHARGVAGLSQGATNRFLQEQNSCSNANQRQMSHSGAAAAPLQPVTHIEFPGITSELALANYWWHPCLAGVKPWPCLSQNRLNNY